MCLPPNTLQLCFLAIICQIKTPKENDLLSDCGQTLTAPCARGLMQTLNTNVWGNIPLPLRVQYIQRMHILVTS